MNTKYFLNCVADNVFRGDATPAIPSAYFIGLSTTEPNIDGGNATEPSTDAGYARVQLTNLSEATDGVTTNSAAINFAESTASWGTVTHFVIYDAASDGNLLMYGALTQPRTVESATIMTIKENFLKLSVLNPS